MASALFTYGSLMFADVYEAVTRRVRVGRAARLEGFERRCVLRASYPGIRPRTGAVTDGVVYTDLSPVELEALDVFEGDIYLRQHVTVQLLDGSGLLEVDAYVVRAAHAHVLTQEAWDPERFAREDKAVFLREYTGFDWIEAPEKRAR